MLQRSERVSMQGLKQMTAKNVMPDPSTIVVRGDSSGE